MKGYLRKKKRELNTKILHEYMLHIKNRLINKRFFESLYVSFGYS